MKSYTAQVKEKVAEIRAYNDAYGDYIKHELRLKSLEQFETDLKGFLEIIETEFEIYRTCDCENCKRQDKILDDISNALEIINKLRKEGII